MQTQETCGVQLTEGILALVEEVYNKTKIDNPYKLLPYICDELEKRYPNNMLEYHLSQMHLETTGAIVRTINCFFFLRNCIPEKPTARNPDFERGEQT